MGLFKKEKKPSAADLILFEEMENKDSRAAELIEELRSGKPLVINFESISDEPQATNRLLAFLAGGTYALDGRTVKIKRYVYLFARNVDFEDGSLTEFINKFYEQE